MAKLKLFDSAFLDIVISRLSQQIIENHDNFTESVILGMQPRGVLFANRIKNRIQEITGIEIEVGKLDITFYRDDFRHRAEPLKANETYVPFSLEGKKVLLIDDVLYTGRTVRAALDAMLAFGRPSKVELVTLIDRKYSRDLPIEATYVGKSVNTIQSQRVIVEWKEQGFESDTIWLASEIE
jgi:pyrimidine operon attenuation protein/uracil phosphoribosyltransferase